MDAHHPGAVTIGGVTYPCALKLEAVGFEPLPMGGAARAQRMRCDIRKTRMATPPAKDALVTCVGVDFKVSEIGGRNVSDAAWIIRCLRWVE